MPPGNCPAAQNFNDIILCNNVARSRLSGHNVRLILRTYRSRTTDLLQFEKQNARAGLVDPIDNSRVSISYRYSHGGNWITGRNVDPYTVHQPEEASGRKALLCKEGFECDFFQGIFQPKNCDVWPRLTHHLPRWHIMKCRYGYAFFLGLAAIQG